VVYSSLPFSYEVDYRDNGYRIPKVALRIPLSIYIRMGGKEAVISNVVSFPTCNYLVTNRKLIGEFLKVFDQEKGIILSVDRKMLRDALTFAANIVPRDPKEDFISDDYREMFSRIYFHYTNGVLRVIASDSRSLFVYSLPVNSVSSDTEVKFSVPGDAVRTYLLCSKKNRNKTVTLNIKDHYVLFDDIAAGTGKDHKFLPYQKVYEGMNDMLKNQRNRITLRFSKEFICDLYQQLYQHRFSYLKVCINYDKVEIIPFYDNGMFVFVSEYVVLQGYTIPIRNSSNVSATLYLRFKTILPYLKRNKDVEVDVYIGKDDIILPMSNSVFSVFSLDLNV